MPGSNNVGEVQANDNPANSSDGKPLRARRFRRRRGPCWPRAFLRLRA